ncbi:DeoR/GlpR family DNA-binding transcription regulator [Planosporangium mesophilum]|uniref:DeoR family transcriptional regulator n=1 Tax=Planosporangium mesophilum TaxID=689768 RepID=A0A8J3T9C2_9ACTN|nr:DeoR/GlpR family DNA-binding transcription regulator [Planosporangium mesophilum]NJC84053.1 DeoR/GlpR transcriptional regulator [Planosporangium mesophilum]GII22945.1 DeoR family transcriptional regulator [Planosporangium mesophilum]
MTVQQRHQAIVEALQAHGRVTVAELSARAGVSEMTIRRDLELLEREGLLQRVHGGAVSTVSGSYEPPFGVRARLRSEEKARIGTAAAALIGANETVVIDAGTTALAVAHALRGRRQLTVCALSVPAAAALGDEPGIRLIAAGGDVRQGEQAFVGPLAERIFDDFRFDTLVLSVGGVDAEHGLTDFNPDDVRLKRAAVAGSRRRIVVADSAKLGRATFARIGPTQLADVLVTDEGASEDQVTALHAAGVNVVIAA